MPGQEWKFVPKIEGGIHGLKRLEVDVDFPLFPFGSDDLAAIDFSISKKSLLRSEN